MKSIEDQARAFSKFDSATDIGTDLGSYRQGLFEGFLAGYQAAKVETNLPTSAKWISVKDRLPEVGKEILWYHEPGGEFSVGLLHHEVEQPFFTHWMPLPKAPKEEW